MQYEPHRAEEKSSGGLNSGFRKPIRYTQMRYIAISQIAVICGGEGGITAAPAARRSLQLTLRVSLRVEPQGSASASPSTTKNGARWAPSFVAEREGFEPSIRCRIHTFQACSFDRSDTSPGRVATQTSHTPAHESVATVAPFRAWRGSRHIVARGPEWVTIDRKGRYGSEIGL
jgi:hypothetical protein